MINNVIAPKELLRIKLCWLKTTDKSGLSKSLTLIIGQHYILTANIHVADGLAYRTIEKLVHFDRNDDDMVCGCYFQTVKKEVGVEVRSAAWSFMIEHNIDFYAIPLFRRNATIYFNRQMAISAKRNHFSIAPAYSLIIHKSQEKHIQWNCLLL